MHGRFIVLAMQLFLLERGACSDCGWLEGGASLPLHQLETAPSGFDFLFRTFCRAIEVTLLFI